MRRKMTIVKVQAAKDGPPSPQDVERWKKIFDEARSPEEVAQYNSHVTVQSVIITNDEDYVTFIRIGDENYAPTISELDEWRNMFKEGMDDPDFMVFTHTSVNIETIPVSKIISVE